MRYIVRVNCEYSSVIEAESSEEALALALPQDVNEWAQAWSETEAEEEKPES